MSSYESALNAVAEKKGLSGEQIGRLDAAVRRTGYVESKNDPTALQGGGGPGRGEFQFETSAGSGAGKTAANRAKSFEKKYGSLNLSEEDRKELNKKDPDFSKISQDGQRAILIADWVMKTPGDEVGAVARGEMPMEDFWLDYHWAGSAEDKEQKRSQWRREMADYERRVGRQN